MYRLAFSQLWCVEPNGYWKDTQNIKPPVKAFGSEQAGSRSWIFLDRNASTVNNLATLVSNAASNLDLQKKVFKRSTTLPRSLVLKRKKNELKADRWTTEILTTQDKCQAWSIHAKGEGTYSNPIGTHRNQTPNSELLPFPSLAADQQCHRPAKRHVPSSYGHGYGT